MDSLILKDWYDEHDECIFSTHKNKSKWNHYHQLIIFVSEKVNLYKTNFKKINHRKKCLHQEAVFSKNITKSRQTQAIIDNLLDIEQLVTTTEVVLFVLFIIFCSYFFSKTISYKSIKSRSFIILSIFLRGCLYGEKLTTKWGLPLSEISPKEIPFANQNMFIWKQISHLTDLIKLRRKWLPTKLIFMWFSLMWETFRTLWISSKNFIIDVWKSPNSFELVEVSYYKGVPLSWF